MEYVATLLFAVFVLLGGIWIGSGLRALFAKSRTAVGLLFSGAFFSLPALSMSAFFLRAEYPTLFYIDAALLVLAIITSAIISPNFVAEIGMGTIAAIGLGGIVMLMGVLIGRVILAQKEDVILGLIFSGCWVFVGLGFFTTGLSTLLHGKSLGLRSKRAGEYEITPTDELNEKPRAKRARKSEDRKA